MTLLASLRFEIKKNVDSLNEKNIDEVRKTILKLLEVAEAMTSILSEEEPISKEEPRNTEDLEVSKLVEPTKEEADVVVEEKEAVLEDFAAGFEQEKGSIFRRRLSGGFLENSIFVPESVIRSEGIEDGDLVSSELVSSDGKRPIYNFTLLKKQVKEREDSDRVVFQYGLVDYNPEIKRYFVEKDVYDNPLLIDDIPTSFIINQQEEESFNMMVGDVVDISWYKGSFLRGKVFWRYRMEEKQNLKTDERSRLEYKNSHKNTKESPPKPVVEIDPLYSGKTISLVGAENNFAEFKKLIEDRGATFIGIHSDAHKNSISASVRKSDLMILAISKTSHEAALYATKRAKEYKVPFKAYSGIGKESFVNTVTEELRKNTH